MKAYCWRTGKIEFGRSTPNGALEIADAPGRELRRHVSASARHAYDGETLLVPGVPEAATDLAAGEAVGRFRDWLFKCLGAA
ncbi:Host nuclease inhibitor protein [uncultured Pleomorphomonas sp.]|uniref:Host nuclease inhibitor protein n=1 Tax=uncultured Pleomorphomonas sp. TaxID=442121 RepID=A0A212LCW9_9HYPH|nr:host nuclease inhibitor protein [uncultured Pleomorphomonas sp.]SCM75413.1 Host nuclease inhibitor protein [uncultured Pleomorphomonas sp.]